MTRTMWAAPISTALAAVALSVIPLNPLAGQLLDKKVFTFLLVEQLEYAPSGAERPILFDAQGWVGGDYNRLWVKAEGDIATTESTGDFEAQLLYSRFVARYWDFQAGLRFDSRFGGGGDASRALLVLGFQGLAPYWFELEPALFVSQDGDVSARLTASYDLLFSQRLIVVPDFEIGAAVQDVPELGIGSGFNDLELGIRARYEIVREFAPYVGFSWITLLGKTADLARSQGQPASDGRLVVGVRAWY